MKAATQWQADLFAQCMSEQMHFTLLRADTGIELPWLWAGFDLLKRFGGLSADSIEWTDRTPTAIGTNVYLPVGYEPDVQIEVLTHLAQHVHQFRAWEMHRAGGLGMWWLYTTKAATRVRFEAEAEIARRELRMVRGCQVDAPAMLSFPLEGGVVFSENERTLGRVLLEMGQGHIAKGVIATPAASVAREVLRTMDPMLLEERFR